MSPRQTSSTTHGPTEDPSLFTPTPRPSWGATLLTRPSRKPFGRGAAAQQLRTMILLWDADTLV